MTAVERLMREHEIILKTLDALEAYASRLLAGDAAVDDMAGFVRFIRAYADDRHHGKEEQILFDTMERHGFSREAGPLAVMLSEHDEGRRQVGIMAAVAEAADTSRASVAVDAARSFVALLRNHIAKENNVLYPMAQQHLPPEVMTEIDTACDEYDFEREQEGRELEQMAAELAARHGA